MEDQGGAESSLRKHPNIFRDEPIKYSELPSSLSIESGVVDAISLLRGTIYPSAQEFGALIVNSNNGHLQPIPIGKSGEGVTSIRHLTLDEQSLQWMETDQNKGSDEGKTKPDIVFVSKALAERHANSIQKLIASGIQVRLDAVPRAILHTHPSGNLPSAGDLSHILYDFHSGNRLIEGVVTNSETFFLIPTEQTPDLFESKKYRFPSDLVDDIERREEDIVQHLTTQKKSATDPTNAARYELIRNICSTYNIGFYVVLNKQRIATRVF